MYVQIHYIVDAYIRWSIISFVHGAWQNCPRTIARMHRKSCTRQQHVHGLWLQPVYAYTFEYPHVCAARTQYTQPCMYICSGICVPAAVRTYTYLNTHVPGLASYVHLQWINDILVRVFVYRLPRVRACLCAAAPCVLLCVCDACTCDAACVCATVYVRVRMCCCVFATASHTYII